MAFGILAPSRRRMPADRGGRTSLFDLHRQMNSMFDDLFNQEGDSGFYSKFGMPAPAMDIHQDDNQLEITAELPGVKEDDVELTIDDGVLTLRGEKKSAREDKERGYSERSYGSFERRITLPSNVDADQCSAEFKDGVLTVTLPKTEKSRGRRIPLGAASKGGSDHEKSLIEGKAEDGKGKRETQKA